MADFYTARCPECGNVIEVDFYNEIGDKVTCYHCDAELELIKIHPPRLKSIHKQFEDERAETGEDEIEDLDEIEGPDDIEEDDMEWDEDKE
ncbi:MAG: hypothetical protein PHW46_01030 [Candidatus Omnitrophica bacterium]|nr:hypothetical protein [Candidatus Omnitrophota bacterium]